MEKIINSYETLFVIDPDLTEEATKALVEKFSKLIADNGEIAEVNEWGKRKLAYAIDYETEGYYALFNFSSEPEFPAELSRVLNITDGVLRSLIINKYGRKRHD